MASSRSPYDENTARRVSVVVSPARPRTKSLRRVLSRSAMERTESRTLGCWREADWRRSSNWSCVNGWIILRMSSGVRVAVVVAAASVEGGGELASPFSSVLRFLEKSIARAVREELGTRDLKG